jgi:hypothetical protein
VAKFIPEKKGGRPAVKKLPFATTPQHLIPLSQSPATGYFA